MDVRDQSTSSPLSAPALRIIDAAERLFAFHGIEGVSLRTVRQAAGHRNNYAIQYHFQDKTGLLNAILNERYIFLERRMAEIMNQVSGSSERPSIRSMMEAVFLPLDELVDEEGRHIHARFLLQFMTQFTPWDGITHPADRQLDAGSMNTLWRHLTAALDYVPEALLRARLFNLTRMFVGALIEWENSTLRGVRTLPHETLVADLLDIASAAIAAKPDPGVFEAAAALPELGLYR